ncbi:hypothetical protein AX334_24810 [Salmonella enterica]|nr:hypothetical protein [Salmonella enterica]EAY8676638.1 hypothetical protein [Salmonella enterica]EBB7877813.1 hypothetical protein [Salmonella enterica]ECI4633169.1 hypothetical protein [Salmonella enterica subsp. enterica serovar Hartford]
MFRLATAEDYEYLPDIGLYELTFDKRPVQGVRCEVPKQGAEDYNNFRKKFKAVIHKEKQRRKNFYRLTEISWNAVFDWAIDRGTPEECRLLLNMYHAENNKKYQERLLELSKCYGFIKETNMLIPLGLILNNMRIADAEKLQNVISKVTSI